MDIIEDLNLIGFDDGLPDTLEDLFDLDDILSEFSTPGLRAPKKQEAAAPAPAPEVIPEIPAPVIAQPEAVEVPNDPTITFAAITDADVMTLPEEPILPESPLQEEVPVFADEPAGQPEPPEADVHIYIPTEEELAPAEVPAGEPLPFAAVSVEAAPAVPEAPAAGLLTKLTGVVAGLFAKKPARQPRKLQTESEWVNPFTSEEPEVTAAEAVEPAVAEEKLPVKEVFCLFDDEPAAEEAAVFVEEPAAEVPAMEIEPELTLFDIMEAAACEEVTEELPAAPAEEEIAVEVPAVEELPAEEEVPVIDFAAEAPAEEPAADDGFVPPALDDLLYEFGDHEDLPVYDMGEEDPFRSAPTLDAPAAKPGVLTQLMGTVAGVFAGLGKKRAAEAAPAAPVAEAEEVPVLDAETLLFTAVEEAAEVEVPVEETFPEAEPIAEEVSEPVYEEAAVEEEPEIVIEEEPEAAAEEELPAEEEDFDLSLLTAEEGADADVDRLLYDLGIADEDVPLYIPDEETVPFTAVAEAPAPAAEPAQPGVMTRIAGMVGGLFAGLMSKKTAESSPVAKAAELPAEETVLFAAVEEAAEEIGTEPHTAETICFTALEDTLAEIHLLDAQPIAEEAALPDVADITPETLAFTAADEALLDVTALFDVITMDDGIPVIPTLEAQEEPAASLDDLLASLGIDDLEEDVRTYIPDEAAPAATLSTDETLPFTAVGDLAVSAPVQEAAKPALMTRIAGTVAAVFAGLMTKKQPAAAQPVAEENIPIYQPNLFAAEDLDDVNPDLLLELEMAADREAEAEAEAAALEAHDRMLLMSEEASVVPESILEAQQEAEEAARLAAEEEEEAPLTAEEEAKLFAWLDSIAAEEAEAAAEIVADEAPAAEEVPAPQSAYMSMFLSEEEPAQLIPQLTIDEEGVEAAEEEIDDMEPVDPVALESTMEMVEQLRHAEESPAEAAARRAKEDDELRYVPDETPAQAIGSAITGRLAAAFSTFTHADAGAGEEDEDLGEEVPPSKAYRYFNKYVNGYRFRLRVSTVLSVIVGWISLGLPVFGSLNNTAVAAAACLMMQLTVMLAGADILAAGVAGVLRRKPGLHSMVFLSCLASIVDACVIIATKGAAGYLPFCGVSAISMCFAIYGSLLYCRSQRLTFKSLEMAAEPMTINVDYGIVDEETTTAYRIPGRPEEFIHRSEEEDLSETVYGVIGPVLTLAIPVLALIAALASKHMEDFFHIMAAMFAASASFGAMVAFPLPYFQVQRDLYAAKAAIAGWTGAKEIGHVATMIVTDRDLFPDETVSISSVRIVDNVPPQLTLSYICSVIVKSGSCLVPAFVQLAENNDCELLPVEEFQCHEAGGLSGKIGPDEVLVASHSYMKLQGFRIPARRKDSENALFLAVNGHVIAYIMVDYKPVKSVRAGLASAIAGNVEMVFAARDFNITPLLISKKFKSPTDTLRFPSYAQRFEITDHAASDTATCAAVVSRKSFYSYAMVVEKARNLYNSVTWAVILSAISSLLGVILMFVMALSGAGAAVTVGKLLIFMLLFVVPTLALCVSITK